MMNTPNLEELAAKAQQGDSHAFGEIYDATFPLIYKFFAFRVKNDDDAKDLTSQVYLEAWEHISRFDTKRNFTAWIFSFVRFRLIDHYRRHKSTASLDAVTEKGDSTDMEAEIDSQLENTKIQSAVLHLPEPYQTVIQLRYLQELDYDEIAAITHKTENNLRVIVKRGLDKLKLLLGDE